MLWKIRTDGLQNLRPSINITLFGWSNKDGWDVLVKKSACWWETCTKFWLENLKEVLTRPSRRWQGDVKIDFRKTGTSCGHLEDVKEDKKSILHRVFCILCFSFSKPQQFSGRNKVNEQYENLLTSLHQLCLNQSPTFIVKKRYISIKCYRDINKLESRCIGLQTKYNGLSNRWQT
jgi:hypothetical protein